MVPMYTVHASVRSALVLLLTYYCAYGPRADLCIQYSRYDKGDMYAVRCKLYLVWVYIR